MEGRDPQTHLTLFSETYDLRPRPPSEPVTFPAVAPAVLRPGRVEIVPQPFHVWQGARERFPASTLVRQSSDAPDSARQARERISYETAQGVGHWRSNIYGVMTSDVSEGWTSRSECTSAVGPADSSRGAILIVATLGEEGVEREAGPEGAWGVVKGLMEHYAARGGQSCLHGLDDRNEADRTFSAMPSAPLSDRTRGDTSLCSARLPVYRGFCRVGPLLRHVPCRTLTCSAAHPRHVARRHTSTHPGGTLRASGDLPL